MLCAYTAFEQGGIFIDSELLQNLGLVHSAEASLSCHISSPARYMGPRFRGLVRRTAPMYNHLLRQANGLLHWDLL